ncbi:MAG: FAD:protein FMN transferase [Bacteroidia bacterium]|nr:FAD:protein FMN transferase [Bacteroidia bacterium]
MKYLTLLLFLTGISFACSNNHTETITIYPLKGQYVHFTGNTQGTTFSIKYKINTDSIKLPEFTALFNNIDNSMSEYVDSSIISRINKNDVNVKTDDLFNSVYKASIKVFEQTDGYFDITVAPLVKAWGFLPSAKVKLDQAKVDSLKEFIGMNKIKLVNNQIIKEDPRIQLDLNSIAQGFSVDYVAIFLESKNITDYMVEIGGEVRTKGLNDKGEPWKVGIDNPEGSEENRGLQTILALSGKSVTTSGSYRKFFEENGVKYSHTINPKTGYPTHHNLLSVTIVADCATIADGYDTPIMVMGFEKGKEFVEKHKFLEAYFIYSDEKGTLKVWKSKGMEKYIVLLN